MPARPTTYAERHSPPARDALAVRRYEDFALGTTAGKFTSDMYQPPMDCVWQISQFTITNVSPGVGIWSLYINKSNPQSLQAQEALMVEDGIPAGQSVVLDLQNALQVYPGNWFHIVSFTPGGNIQTRFYIQQVPF